MLDRTRNREREREREKGKRDKKERYATNQLVKIYRVANTKKKEKERKRAKGEKSQQLYKSAVGNTRNEGREEERERVHSSYLKCIGY